MASSPNPHFSKWLAWSFTALFCLLFVVQIVGGFLYNSNATPPLFIILTTIVTFLGLALAFIQIFPGGIASLLQSLHIPRFGTFLRGKGLLTILMILLIVSLLLNITLLLTKTQLDVGHTTDPTPVPTVTRLPSPTSTTDTVTPSPPPPSTPGETAPTKVTVISTFSVKNTDEELPDGVYFRHSLQPEPGQPTPTPVYGLGVFKTDLIQLSCWAWGDDQHGDKVWYYSYNVTRPTVAGRPNKGWLNGHYINDSMPANHPAPVIPQCKNPLPVGG